jgi:hypothetical protein
MPTDRAGRRSAHASTMEIAQEQSRINQESTRPTLWLRAKHVQRRNDILEWNGSRMEWLMATPSQNS